MTPEDFLELWKRRYGNCLPIGSYLREAYRSRWLRIHTLPKGKRYATVNDEYRTILHRHNTLLSDLLREDEVFVLVSVGYSFSPSPTSTVLETDVWIEGSQHWLSARMPDIEEDDEPNYCHFFMSENRWKAGSFDPLLKMVSDDSVANILFVGSDASTIYHPYDGGGDVFLPSETVRASYAQRYSEWRSPHPLGL